MIDSALSCPEPPSGWYYSTGGEGAQLQVQLQSSKACRVSLTPDRVTTYLALIEEWFRGRCEGACEPQSAFKLESTDNPGWLMTIDVDPVHLKSVSGQCGDEVALRVESQVPDGKIRLFSESLTSCMESVVSLITRELSDDAGKRKTRPRETDSGVYMTHIQEMTCLEKIDEWYRERCDDVWEHHSGFTIESADSLGWLVTIDMDPVDFNSVWGWCEKIEAHHRVEVQMMEGNIRISSASLNSCLEAVVTLIIHEQAEPAFRGKSSGNRAHMNRAHYQAHLALIEEWFKEHLSVFSLKNTESRGWMVTLDVSPFDLDSILQLRKIVEAREIVRVKVADGKIRIRSESLASCIDSVAILIDLHEQSRNPPERAVHSQRR